MLCVRGGAVRIMVGCNIEKELTLYPSETELQGTAEIFKGL